MRESSWLNAFCVEILSKHIENLTPDLNFSIFPVISMYCSTNFQLQAGEFFAIRQHFWWKLNKRHLMTGQKSLHGRKWRCCLPYSALWILMRRRNKVTKPGWRCWVIKTRLWPDFLCLVPSCLHIHHAHNSRRYLSCCQCSAIKRSCSLSSFAIFAGSIFSLAVDSCLPMVIEPWELVSAIRLILRCSEPWPRT